MSFLDSPPVQTGFAAMIFLAANLLTGCGYVESATQPEALPAFAIQGHVHGGVYPIQGANISLMETQSNGYGGAAKLLLQTTSDNNGYFTFPDTGWSCDSNQYAYITVTSGHTSTNAVNNNVGQIGVIGNCGQVLANKTEIDAVQVYVSELSTIAAAYSLRNFITINNTNASTGNQIINISAPANNNASSGVCTFSSPTSCVAAGIAHGFENATNLVQSVSFNGQLPSGQARTVPPTNANGFVPQAEINTLANILQSCVDSPGGTVANFSSYVPGGSSSSRCGDLFYWATPPGGTPPTNTLQVALNMAQYPTNNVLNLYNLQPRAVFFTPTLSQVPNDLTLSVFYLTETFGANTGNLTVPVALTLDSNDDVFVLAASANGTSNTQTAVLGMATNGAILFAGPVSTTLLSPSAITTDALDNIWFTNDSAGVTGGLYKASPATGAITTGTLLPSAAGLVADKFNNVWVSLDAAGVKSIQKFSNSSLTGGTVVATSASNILGSNLRSLSMDTKGDLWALNTTGSTSAAVVFPNTGTLLAPTYTSNILTQGLNGSAGYGAGINAAGQVYYPLANQVDGSTYNGGLTTNNQGTFNAAAQNNAKYNVPNQAEVDGAGNLFWTDFEANGQIFQFVPSSSGNMNQGSLHAILPCYPVNGTCYVPAVANARGMQVDSTGALWYVADASYYGYPIGVIVQTLGVGAPTWPQQSLQQPGTMPQ